MSTPAVRSGLDHLLSDTELLQRLRGKRLGLLVNPTSVTADLTHAIEALQEAGLTLHLLFGPEHGVRADAQDMEAVDETTDPISGLPCISLYGHTFESLKPRPEHLADLDLVLCDIQDVGSRYYTYVYSIGLMMDACGDADVPVWVLDRPNPLGGLTLEGNIVDPSCRSFVGMQPLPNRHALTPGELAHFFLRHGGWECDLEVVPLQGWRRSMWFDDTGLPWVMPSPNMPTLDTATVYPGQCLLEGTNLSEGRGTTRPFELFGAPFIDPMTVLAVLSEYELPGLTLRPTAFRPTFQKHGGHTCRGFQTHITDRDAYSSMAMSYALIAVLLRLYPDAFQWREEAYEFVDDQLAIDLLFGHASVRRDLEAGAHPLHLLESFQDQLRDFDDRRQACLLYHD